MSEPDVTNAPTEAAARPDGVPTDAVDISDDGGLCKRVLTAGDPAEGTPCIGAEVQVHYVGTLLSDGSKFDSSRDRPGNFKFKIGKGQVILGWDKGVATMHKGEVAELFCRADYAYGVSGSPPKIPGGATLKFEVELLSWAEPTKERWELSAGEKLAKGRDLKAEGGSAFKAGEWSAARVRTLIEPTDAHAGAPLVRPSTPRVAGQVRVCHRVGVAAPWDGV
jgi:hypothetical protein